MIRVVAGGTWLGRWEIGSQIGVACALFTAAGGVWGWCAGRVGGDRCGGRIAIADRSTVYHAILPCTILNRQLARPRAGPVASS